MYYKQLDELLFERRWQRLRFEVLGILLILFVLGHLTIRKHKVDGLQPITADPATANTAVWTPDCPTCEKSILSLSIISLKKNGTWTLSTYN
jgi:hypothetical protein